MIFITKFFEKRDYQRLVNDLMDVIIQNWCLCKYIYVSCSNSEQLTDYRNFLEFYIHKIRRFKVKDDRDKFKWTSEVIIDKAGFTNIDIVRETCEFVLDQSNILYEEKEFLYREFIKAIPDLIDCLSEIISVKEFFRKTLTQKNFSVKVKIH